MNPKQANSTPDLWMQEINNASKLTEEVGEMISQRSSLPASGPETQRHMSGARRKMTILRTKLETLQSLLPKLPAGFPTLSAREVNRRQEMLKSLSLKAGELAPKLNMSISADRDKLLGLDTKPNEVIEKASKLDNRSLVSFQRQIMQEQDEDLAQLEETVASTKHIALAVNCELDLHTRLLENLEDHVDTTDSQLQRVQRKLVMLKRSTKGSCSCLILLILTIVFFIFVALALLKYL